MTDVVISHRQEQNPDYNHKELVMQVVVNLRFGNGDFERGFEKIALSTCVDENQNSTELKVKLPPAPLIPGLYQNWQDKYSELVGTSRRKVLSKLPVVTGVDNENIGRGFSKQQPTNYSYSQSQKECNQYAEELRIQLNQWLSQIKSQLQAIELNTNSDILLTINTENITSQITKDILHRLPWREWDYFNNNSTFEAVLCLSKSPTSVTHPPSVANPPSLTNPSLATDDIFRRVRITSIFGDSTDIDVATDKELIAKLQKQGAELINLEQPQRQDFIKLWDEVCDILFYSGHSESCFDGTVGSLQINSTDSLNLQEIRNTFSEAIRKGLKLAIFNSCDGLGLAKQLADLHLPYIIVWREPVPDKIAQKFLEYFLSSYAEGKSLFHSVRDARIKLVELTNSAEKEKQIPGLQWLPIICKNTTDAPPTWEELGGLTGKLPDCPYQGLSAFKEENKDFFFGRDDVIADLVEAVNSKALVPVIGASGSGKTSVVFAGLVPQLKDIANVEIVSFRPGKNPFDALAVALNRIQNIQPSDRRLEELELALNLQQDEQSLCKFIKYLKNLTPQPPSLRGKGEKLKPLSCEERGLERGSPQRFVIIADQFEELYTLTEDSLRQPFLDLLLYAVQNAPLFTLVLTLRADFMGKALDYQPMGEAFNKYPPVLLTPMKREDLQTAIAQPAAKLKVELEQGLTSKLIDDLGNQPGRLPLLEFTLSLLWEKHDRWYLTHKAYEEIGGLEKALAKYADGVLNSLSADEKEKAERIFIQLISPGEGTEDTKRKATRGEVGEDNWGLVEELATERLVVTGWDGSTQQKTVEIIHEALIREWGMLHRWIQSNRRFRIWQERLQFEVVKWDKNRDEKYFLSGGNLGEAEGWLSDEKYRDYLSYAQREFIRLSLDTRDKKIKEEKRKQIRTVIGFAGLSVVSLVIAAFAGFNWMQSEIRATSSNLSRLAINSKSSFNGDFHHDAIMEAMKASQLLSNTWWEESIPNDIKQEVKAALFNVINDSIFVNDTLKGHQDRVSSVVFSPDGKTVASASYDNTAIIWDAKSGKLIQTLKGHQDGVTSVVFSPDGNTIVSASSDKTVIIWNAKTGKPIQTLKGHQSYVTSAVFSPDGNTIASASSDKTVIIWDVKTGKPIQTLKGDVSQVNSVVFSPDGKTVAAASYDSTVIIWDVKTGKPIQTLQGGQGGVLSVVFSPDGKTVAAASYDSTVIIWDVKTGKPIQTLQGGQGGVFSVVFSPDGNTIASASGDRRVIVWNAVTGKPIQTLKGHQSSVNSLVFNPDGNTIAGASWDSTVIIWNAVTGKPIQTLKGHQYSVNSLVFSPDGNTIAGASYDETFFIWDAVTGKPIQTLKGHQSSVNSVVFSPDGNTIASASSDFRVIIWDAVTGKPIQTLKKHQGWVNSVVFSPDGNTIASASSDKTVIIWDAVTGKPIQTLKGHQDHVSSVVFSPNGNTIAAASWDNTVIIWDAVTGKTIQTLKGHQDNVNSVVFSPDGNTIASASSDKTVIIWDAKTGKQIQTLKGHQDNVNSVVFSPDGKTIASASTDKTVIIWDAKTGKPIQTFKGHQHRVNSVIFSPDGKTIASASTDKTIKLWNWDFEDLVEKGCERFKDHLANNPEKLEQLEICQNEETLTEVASTLVEEGEDLAKLLNYEGAVEKFRKAKKWNPKLDINPEEKAKLLNY